MRIALLSTLDRAPKPGTVRPAFAAFAGAMVVERQLDLAIKLGCERVACLVDAVEREVVELQGRAESAGIKFRAIRHPSRLSGMVTAEDELFVVAPGVLPDDAEVEETLTGKGVLAFPADTAVPLGYERIDLELAWGGVMLVPGRIVERLAELPGDVDVPSTLMRLSLQSGSPIRHLDRDLLSEGHWHIDAERAELDAREKRWIDAQRRKIAFRAPGLAVAERAGARLARDILGRSVESVPILAAIASVITAVGLAAFGFPAAGIAMTALAALFGHLAGVVDRVAQLSRPKTNRGLLHRLLGHAIDPVFIFLLAISAPEEFGFLRVFVPLVLFGLLRLGESYSSKKWRATYADRILLGFLLAPAAFLGFSTEMAAAIALLVLATRFFPTLRGD